MRDASFTLHPEAPARAAGPFHAVYIVESSARACWRILDVFTQDLGVAATRAGARAAVRALYAGTAR